MMNAPLMIAKTITSPMIHHTSFQTKRQKVTTSIATVASMI